MGHMIRDHQILDMGPEQGLSHLHPNDHVRLGNYVNYRNESIHPVLRAPWNSAVLHLQFIDPCRTNCVPASHFNGMQHHQSVSSNYVGDVAPANFYNPHMPSSSNGLVESRSSSIIFQPVPPFSYHRNYFLQRNQMNQSFQPPINASMELFGNCVDDGRYSNQNYTDTTAYMHDFLLVTRGDSSTTSSLWSNGTLMTSMRHMICNHQLLDMGSEQGFSHLHPNHYVLLGNSVNYRNGSIHPVLPAPGNSADLHLQFTDPCMTNCVHASHFNGMQYHRSVSSNYVGMCLNSVPLEDADMGIRGYQGNSSNRCAAFNMHHPSFSNTYQNDSHVQSLQVDVYSHQTQMSAAPYWHPFDNLLANNVYCLRDDQRSGFRFVGPMPSTSRPIDIPLIFEAVPGISYDPRNPPFEDAAELMGTSRFSSFEDDFDPYNDMRMDIDDMSYEELMDLEESIGDVKTGLSEEFILKNLRTSMHVQQSTSSSLGSPSQSASENGICIVCQVEYEENERIGTLDCGHSYHADCIKQWLAVKNICPICIAPALVADKREG